MSNYPNAYDDDTTLPPVNDNIDQIGGDAINATRDAILAIETALGTNIAGSAPNLATRIGVFINPDGSPNASIIYSLGLVVLPVTNSQIAEAAGIPESKLLLDYRTQDLFNYIRDLAKDVNLAIGWISVSGVKLEPHLIGALYRHDLAQIDVAETSAQFLNNVYRTFRDNTDAYTLVNDMNNELLAHQWADGSPFGIEKNITTNNGSVYPNYYAHTASGIFLNTSRFSTIPQLDNNVQLFAEYIDSASIFLLGTRIQNLYSSGISRVSQSSTLTTDGYGQAIVPVTPAIAFLENIGNAGTPVDSINNGDDIIEFKPTIAVPDNNFFDSQWALVKPGDIIRVTYGDGYNIEVPYLIKEKKYSGVIGSKKYVVRIAGKNAFYSPNAIARIDRPLFNPNKYGELALSPVTVDNFLAPPATPSLIVNNPRGAQALGVGFNADQFDETHYLLYLALFPTGNPSDGYTFLPGIDVTGNLGKTPGLYTLDSIVQATNTAFRAPGFNYRFTAFSYKGEYGICLADSYGNSGFSIVSAVISPNGVIDQASTELHFPNNVIDLIPNVGNSAPDPLGFGPTGSGVASPPFQTKYGTSTNSTASQFPTILFIPLRRNNYYVDGTELERLAIENDQALDQYGDGYWVATVQTVNTFPGRVETRYRIPLDLAASGLKVGKTIVVQELPAGGSGHLVDFGRFIIESVTFNCAPNVYTDIVVYDSVHAAGHSPVPTIQPFAQVAIYFSADSVSFNVESATDLTVVGPFKRHFEVYVNDAAETFTQERGRMSVAGTTTINSGTVYSVPLYAYLALGDLDLLTISPKLRGYQFGEVNKITLNIFSYSSVTGIFDGYLASYDGTYFTHFGPRTQARQGDVMRFYDETNVDYIDFILDINTTISSFTNQVIDIQLFPSLQLDTELMLLGTCQVNDSTQTVNNIIDKREFGNTSEKDLSSSVFDIISLPEKLLHVNGVVRGFDIFDIFSGSSEGIITFQGGVVLVNGQIVNINNDSISIPIVQESFSFQFYPVNWAVCINDIGDYEAIPLLDYDATLPPFGTPNSPNRTFMANDFVSSTTYNVPAVLFANLVNFRPDLTVLYIVGSVITGTPSAPIITLTVKDTRRFVYKKDWAERPALVEDAHIGEFRNLTALGQWFNLDNHYSNAAYIKGTFTDPSISFSFQNPASLYGDGAAIIQPSDGSVFAESIDFYNVQFNAADLDFVQGSFTKCTFNYAPNGSHSFATLGGTTDIRLTDCIINYTTTNGPLQFLGTTLLDNVFINVSATNAALGFFGTIAKNCTINITGSNCLITVDSNSSLTNCTFNLNGSSTTWNFQGKASNCTFNFNSNTSTLPIVVSSIAGDTFNLVGNKFILNLTSNAPTSILSVPDTSNGIIEGNFFFRKNNTLVNGYILAPASYTSGEVAVTNNFFDHSTIDGSNLNVVKNLPIFWAFTDNLNTPPTVVVNQITPGAAYTVTTNDYVIAVTITVPITINLPSVALSPLGRTLVIKDVTGTSDVNPVTLHRANISETIEGLASDFIYRSPFGSITLVTTSTGWIMI